MLNHIHPEAVLFIDIETVPQAASFNELDEEYQQLWIEKSRFFREKDSIDIPESYFQAGIYAEFGKVICVSAGYLSQRAGSRIFRCTSFFGDDEKELLTGFAGLLESHYNHPFRILCAHNGREFDLPYLSRRMLVNGIPLPRMLDLAGKKPWEIPHIDTMELWKFGDYKHYTSLKLLAKIMGIPTPKDDIDGSMVRQVYYEENDLNRIENYCRKDVLAVAQVFLKYRGEELLHEEEVVAA
ncbi:MAG: 3'-5' exonuclease [Crocinitomicaceae bacterium]|nr:3'-5' exonuclease [Crocinitomicaceae bacterium]